LSVGIAGIGAATDVARVTAVVEKVSASPYATSVFEET
jgi:hypothetical protein